MSASETLDSFNFTKVYNMLGGILTWESGGYPVWTATVHNLDTTLNYDTIQAAIDAPQTLDGHTIAVDGGTYYENVVVNKTVSIIGENRSTTIIDGDNTGYGVKIWSNDVEISDFTIRNGHFVAVRVYENVSMVMIRNNIILDSEWGIYLGLCSNNTVKRNLVQGCGEGVFLESSSHNLIVLNTIEDNNYGIELKTAPHIPEVPPPPPSSFNTIYHNNLINNSHQALDYGYGNQWDNGCEGNYWSDYNGTDLDGDGIGDTELPWEGVDYCPLMSPFMRGDVNHDGVVDIADVVLITVRYRSQLGDENWNCHSDIAEPYGIIDISDVVAATSNYRKEWNP